MLCAARVTCKGASLCGGVWGGRAQLPHLREPARQPGFTRPSPNLEQEWGRAWQVCPAHLGSALRGSPRGG